MKQLTLLDKMLLLSETREVPMHVGGLAASPKKINGDRPRLILANAPGARGDNSIVVCPRFSISLLRSKVAFFEKAVIYLLKKCYY